MYKKCKAEMITVNQTWLKLAERTQESSKTVNSVNWVVFTVLNKLQKSGKAKITRYLLNTKRSRDHCKAFYLGPIQ